MNWSRASQLEKTRKAFNAKVAFSIVTFPPRFKVFAGADIREETGHPSQGDTVPFLEPTDEEFCLIHA